MSELADNINAQVDSYVGNSGLLAFQNFNLNRILHLIVQLADANSGGSASSADIIPVGSALFSTATNCPLPALNGEALRIYWGEGQKFLEQDNSEWTPLAGGGFTVLLPGFDASKGNYHFYVFKES